MSDDPAALARVVALAQTPAALGHYMHWDELRHREPPAGYSATEWWGAIQLARGAIRRELPLRDARGVPFTIAAHVEVQQLLHEIDRDAGPILINENRDRYIVSSVIEEAITSSQLEGAST